MLKDILIYRRREGGKGQPYKRRKRMSKKKNDEFNLIFFCVAFCGP